MTEREASVTPPRWMSRSERFMAVAASLLALSAIVVVIGLISLARVHGAVMEEIARNHGARVATYGLLQASIDAETGQRGYLLTRDQTFLGPYTTGRAAAVEHTAQLRETLRGEPGYLAELARAEARLNDAFDAMADVIALREAGALTEPEFRAELRRGKQTMDALRAEFAQLLRALEQRIDRVRQEERRTTDALYWIGGLMAFCTMLAVALTIQALRSERKSWGAAFTALSEANAAAEHARAQATASDLAKTRFLAVASHDMRQPLHALTLYISALERRVEGDEARGILTKMERATTSMATMFATLLDLARIQAGVVHPEIGAFALQHVLDRVVAEHPGVTVTAEATAVVVRSDAALLERILRNLVSNAVKHGGGDVRLSVSVHGQHADIAVDDAGPGVPPADRERIFEEFVRLGGRAEGLGLGLAIVKRVAFMLGAPIRVEDAPGGGARFVVTTPIAGADHAEADRAAPQARLDGVPVLVMDDDQLAREAIAGAMRDMGASVVECANGASVERALNQGARPKLLVMDLRIDGELCGVAISNAVRARLNPPPPVLVLTGDTGPETLVLLRTSGFAWLIKPVDPRALREAAVRQIEDARVNTI